MFSNDTQDRALPFSYSMLQGIWLWCSAGIDVLISTALCFALRSCTFPNVSASGPDRPATDVSGFNTVTDGMLRYYISLGMFGWVCRECIMTVLAAAETALYTSVLATAGAILCVAFDADDYSTINIPIASASCLPRTRLGLTFWTGS
jgi:hypothetical protein